MKKMIYITLLFLSCNNKTNQSDKTFDIDSTYKTVPENRIDVSQFYTHKDTIEIAKENSGILIYSNNEFNQIVDNFPSLYSDNVMDPDMNYSCAKIWKDVVDKKGIKTHISFNSEVGQDEYYILYAYFLKRKNGEKKYAELRKKIIEIYLNINSLFANLQYGGTGFGHQQSRIIGYAEYSVYLYSLIEKNIEKTYDITKQKEYYIESLRQLIKDESEIDFYTLGQEKIERSEKLNKIVDKIDAAINNNFYLRRAQEFQYRHYNFY